MKKAIIVMGSILIASVLVIYLYITISCSNLINRILKSSLNNYGEFDMRYEGIISEQHYSWLNFREKPIARGYLESEVEEQYSSSIHIVVHDLKNVTVVIKYRYNLSDKNGKTITSTGGGRMSIKMKFIDGRWIIISVHDQP